jgi:hypothetical protein
MFFQAVGPLLTKAALALETDTVSAGDEFAARQRRRVTRLLGRLGECWTGVFEALLHENVLHREAALAARAALAAHGAEVPPVDAGPTDADPLDVHLTQLAELDRLVIALHDAGGDEWARRARRHLRRGLSEAARVESELLEPPASS